MLNLYTWSWCSSRGGDCPHMRNYQQHNRLVNYCSVTLIWYFVFYAFNRLRTGSQLMQQNLTGPRLGFISQDCMSPFWPHKFMLCAESILTTQVHALCRVRFDHTSSCFVLSPFWPHKFMVCAESILTTQVHDLCTVHFDHTSSWFVLAECCGRWETCRDAA